MNQQSGTYGSQKKSVGATSRPFYQGIQRSSAEALFAHSKDTAIKTRNQNVDTVPRHTGVTNVHNTRLLMKEGSA